MVSQPPPRTLVVTGEPFNRRSATGITLAGLFEGWPSDRLFEIYTADLARSADFEWQSWRMSNADLAGLGGWLRPLVPRRMTVTSDLPTLDGPKHSLRSKLRPWLAPWLDLIPYSPPPELLERLDAFRPQIIYSMLGNIRLTRLVNALAHRFEIPVVPHFMDDWPTTYAVPGRSAATFVSRMMINRALARLMRQAPRGFAIGDQMAEEYAERFSRPFESFMNPVDLPPEKVRDIGPHRTRLGYVGGLHLSRHVNLLEIAGAVSRLRTQGLEVDFRVWAPPADLARHGPNLVAAGVQCSSLAPDEVPGALEDLDIAVHVEAFGHREAEYTRLSVSTKIPQYFAAGIPVLVYGPSGAASCRYIVENGCGVGLGRPDGDPIVPLRAMIEDIASRRRMGANGRRLAAERHDAKVERIRFRSQLIRAAGLARSG